LPFWEIKEQSEQKVNEIVKLSGLPEIAVRVLINNGLTDLEKIKNFLNIKAENMHSPFLFKDMEKAVAIIKAAIFKNEKIAIYGDYDVDGVTSVALLYLYLSSKGVEVSFYIPDRSDEGYGINKSALDKLKNDGVDLIITVDSGITACEEIAYAYEIGMQVIVTDHHECKTQVPVCEAVINPKVDEGYPFSGLAGVGVAFKLVCALEGEDNTTAILNNYGDIIALGTVADVMPLVDENRIITSIGVSKLNKRNGILGIRALLYAAGIEKSKKVNTSTISFVLSPRINAAGRMGSAQKALELFLADTPDSSLEIAQHLCRENTARQETENVIYTQAIEQFKSTYDPDKDLVCILHGENWHQGIIGIAASKIADRFNVPTILISTQDGIGKGSGRSIKGFNLYEALESCKDCLIKYGGHELAAGMSICVDKIPEFKEKINRYASENIDKSLLNPVICAECRADLKDINIETINTLKRFEPYGVANPDPVFYLDNVEITYTSAVSEGKHTKFSAFSENGNIPAIFFNQKFSEFSFKAGDKIDIMCRFDINEFKGAKTPQMLVKAVRAHQ